VTEICLYAQVHQPFRLRPFRLFDIGTGADCFHDGENARIVRKVAERCYRPANQLLTRLIRNSGGQFRLALSLSGVLLEQLERWSPETLASFQELVGTGGVELLGETYYHSLAALADEAEFRSQVRLHGETIHRLFGQRPRVFRNTELIYWDGLAPVVSDLGYGAILVEGAEHAMDWRTPNYVYAAAGTARLRLLARNYRLSDDVGFRFSSREWDGWPLRAETYASWLAAAPGEIVNLFLDYETFGEHQWADTGIFDFLAHLPPACFREGMRFVQPGELARRAPVAELGFSRPTSWADQERDVTAWLGNRIQQAAHERLYAMRPAVLATGEEALIDRWRRLTTSDHVYYMCTKWFADGDVHKYFSPWESPYDAFVAFMNVLEDLEQQIRAARPAGREVDQQDDFIPGAGLGAMLEPAVESDPDVSLIPSPP
jgi:alpha-amylase